MQQNMPQFGSLHIVPPIHEADNTARTMISESWASEAIWLEPRVFTITMVDLIGQNSSLKGSQT